ncbi:MAG: DUF4825 domain-containing protein [Bacillota bacterium]|nr:DUF4825 domain-containing protein [Bacillota bacterium]MDW7678883.1 DUF4825 domain-containing protein [Bacillota bacterium]
MSRMKKILTITFIAVLILAALLSLRLNDDTSSNSSQEIPPEETAATASPFAREIYAARNPYVGDAGKNGELLRLLGISEAIGPFHQELSTDAPPYVLQVVFEEVPEDVEELNRQMTRYSLLLLALIENAGEIHWSYPVESADDSGRVNHQTERALLFETLAVEPAGYSLSPEVLDRLLAADE